MRKILSILAPLMFFIVSSCTTSNVYTDALEGLDYTQYKTYAWLPSVDTANGRVYNNPILTKNLRGVINDQMQARGYEIDVEDPDLLVLMHKNFAEKEAMVRTPVYNSYSYYYPGFSVGPTYPYYYHNWYSVPRVTGYDIERVEFTQGTVVVDIIETETNELIWRGWSTVEENRPQEIQAQMKEAVEDIFDRYPVKSRKVQK